MKNSKKLVIGNWKENPLELEEVKNIANTVKRAMRNIKKTQVVICPPHIYIPTLLYLPTSNLFLGAQDAFYETYGPFTGEVSAASLYQFKVRYVIVGHSERRAFGETNEIVNKKVLSVLNNGMSAIVCVGEMQRDHHGDYLGFVENQLKVGLRNVGRKNLSRLLITYEPVFFVGAKEAMPPQDIFEMAIFIRKILRDMFGTYSEDVKVLYGGTVETSDADRIIRDGGVSGLLVGRESLKPKDFVEIIKLVDSI